MAGSSFGTQIDDVTAIQTYVQGLVTKSAQAATLKAQLLAWLNNAGWYDKNFSDSWYDELRTRRNQLNIANAVTPADKAAVTQTLTTGLTNEELAGKPRPNIDPVSGATGTQFAKPTVPGVKVGKPPQVTGTSTKLLANMKSGSKGDQVKQWQTFLGLAPPTGIFDALTVSKTKAWQSANALTADGIVGPKSWAIAFPVATTPFAASSGSAATINNAFAAPKPATIGPQTNPVAAASAAVPGTPAAKAAAAAGATVAAAKTAEAGMLGSISKLPTWQKVLGALGILGLVGGTVISHHGGIPPKHQPRRYR